MENMVPAFKTFFDGIGKLVGKVMELVGVLWGDGTGPLAIAVGAIANVFSVLLSIIGNIGGAIATAIDFVMKLGKAIMDSPIGFLIKAIAGVIGGVGGAVSGVLGLKDAAPMSFAGASPTNTGSYGPNRGMTVTSNLYVSGTKVATAVNGPLGRAAGSGTSRNDPRS